MVRETIRSSTRLLIGSVALFVSACSFTFVDGPPRHAPAYVSAPREVPCTQSRLAPILDTTGAALELTRAAVALASSRSAYEKYGLDRSWEAGLGIAFAALFASSAVYGFVVTHECARYYRNLSIVSLATVEKQRSW